MTLPFAPGSSTSQAAAESMEGSARNVAHQIFRFFVSQGQHGATTDEVEVALRLTHQTASARVHALTTSGLLIQPPGRPTRKTRGLRSAAVWLAREDLNFHALYREPQRGAGAKALQEAGRAYVDAVGTEDEESAHEALLDAAWAAYGQGPRPKFVVEEDALEEDWLGR
jgi:hypothetical protein